jgi:hypothetical protein
LIPKGADKMRMLRLFDCPEGRRIHATQWGRINKTILVSSYSATYWS